MEFGYLRRRARTTAEQYNELHSVKKEPLWGVSDYYQGFIGDVGDLGKLLQERHGRRSTPEGTHGLGHELADCLWSLLVIAQETGTDLEREFLHMVYDLESRLNDQITEHRRAEISGTDD